MEHEQQRLQSFHIFAFHVSFNGTHIRHSSSERSSKKQQKMTQYKLGESSHESLLNDMQKALLALNDT